MAFCLNQERYGELLDPFNGLEDLQDLIIRTPREPGITFSDDPLRMMRAYGSPRSWASIFTPTHLTPFGITGRG